MNLYAIAIYAENSKQMFLIAASVKAANERSATAAAMQYAQEKKPPQSGYYNHQVEVYQIRKG